MDYHYKAFISYKHDPVDSKIAGTIQTKLERFHIPRALQKEKGIRNLRPVFRDKEELSATEDLNDTIRAALLDSEFLIVICSTRSIRSIWVAKEVAFFLEHHDMNKVLTVIVDGEPQEVIPPVLLHRERTFTDENGQTVTVTEEMEPLSCDYRIELRKANKEEFPRLAAALIGCRYNDLRQRQRQYQMRLMGAGLVGLSALMVYFVWSNIRIRENLRESQISRSRNLAYLSTASLKENDRLQAVSYALEALPSEGNDCPVIYEAAYALSKAEGAYNFPDTLDIEEVAEFAARYRVNAFKTADNGNYLAMQDGDQVLRFFDVGSGEEIGEVRLDGTAQLLSVMKDEILLVTSGNSLTAIDMQHAQKLWSQTFESSVLGMSVMEGSDENEPVIALVFSGHVLLITDDGKEILGRFDSGLEETPFSYRPEHPYIYTRHLFGEDEHGHSLYYDAGSGLLYVLSRGGANYDDTDIGGVLVINGKDLSADFRPMHITCAGQYSMTADDTGIYLVLNRRKDDYHLNSIVEDDARRTDWIMFNEGAMSVIKADPEGNVLWETRIPYNGTNMIGKTAVFTMENVFESEKEKSTTAGVILSNQVTYLDGESGEICGASRLQNEISNLWYTSGKDGMFVFTIDGGISIVYPSDRSVTTYRALKEDAACGGICYPDAFEDSMCLYVQYTDKIRIYASHTGDEEYTAYTGPTLESNLFYGSLIGRDYYVCSMGNEELAVLDLRDHTVRTKTMEDYGLTLKEDLLYMDPEDKFYIVSGSSDEGTVLKKVFLNDLHADSIFGPGMRKEEEEFSYMTDPVCVGDRIIYYAVKSGRNLPRPFSMILYDISEDTWSIRALDFKMLNLLLPMSISSDGETTLVQDQWENGYLIRTADGSVTDLSRKIPLWEESVWREDGRAFALCKSGAEQNQIISIDTQGKTLFEVGREYIQPFSMQYHGNSLWVLYEDYMLYEYDAKTGKELRTISVETNRNPLDKRFKWDFTDDGQLILYLGNIAAQIDLELGGMVAEVCNSAGYVPPKDQMLVINTEKDEGDERVFVGYPRYTVEDLIRKGEAD